MSVFHARVAGDTFWDDVEAETAALAASMFAETLINEGSCLQRDGDKAIIEVIEAADCGDWLLHKRFEASACVTTKIDINRLSF